MDYKNNHFILSQISAQGPHEQPIFFYYKYLLLLKQSIFLCVALPKIHHKTCTRKLQCTHFCIKFCCCCWMQLFIAFIVCKEDLVNVFVVGLFCSSFDCIFCFCFAAAVKTRENGNYILGRPKKMDLIYLYLFGLFVVFEMQRASRFVQTHNNQKFFASIVRIYSTATVSATTVLATEKKFHFIFFFPFPFCHVIELNECGGIPLKSSRIYSNGILKLDRFLESKLEFKKKWEFNREHVKSFNIKNSY